MIQLLENVMQVLHCVQVDLVIAIKGNVLALAQAQLQ